MIDYYDDERDPLREAFDDYVLAPRDVVPRNIEHRTADLHRLAGTGQTVTYYDFTPDGITKHTEELTVTAPIYAKGIEND